MKRPSIIERSYHSLDQAFELVGKARYGNEWRGTEVDCFGGEDHRPKDDNPNLTQHEERYLGARVDLFEFLYDREEEVEGLAESGKNSSVPAYAWKCITDDFEICIRDGKVWQGNRVSGKSWRVHVDKGELHVVLQAHRDRRRRAGQGNFKGKGGAPLLFDWDRIVEVIVRAYEKDPPPASRAEAARLVAETLEHANISVPGYTSLRIRIRKLDEDGLLAKR